jgi:hypothetical protein
MDDETLIQADQAEKAVAQVRESLREFLIDKCGPEKANELSRLFSEGTWTHDHPILYETACDSGFACKLRHPARNPRFDEPISAAGSATAHGRILPGAAEEQRRVVPKLKLRASGGFPPNRREGAHILQVGSKSTTS